MKPRISIAALLLLVSVGCGTGGEVSSVAPSPQATPPGTPGTGTLEGRVTQGEPPDAVSFGGPVTVRFGEDAVTAEVAHTPRQRARGLMFRESLAQDAAMLFIFSELRQGGFWMKNTLIPLSIAYMRSVEGEGTRYEVVSILDMDPCTADPCPSFDPGVPYDAALEVNQGWFGEHGVAVGSVAVVEGDLPAPS